MTVKLVTAMDNEELLNKLSEKTARHLESYNDIEISHSFTIPTIAVSFLEQMLEVAHGRNLLIRKDNLGNILINEESPQNYGYDTILTLKRPE
jgi:hypothetical protein